MKARSPRHGSMQFWPHRRAKKEAPVIKKYPSVKEAIPLSFAGYKVGMTHIQFTQTDKNSPKKGETVMVPVTIVACPPLKVVGIRTYGIKDNATQPTSQILIDKFPKYLERTLPQPKTRKAKLSEKNNTQVTLLVATQPHELSIGRKAPHVFEVGIGGTPEEQATYAKEQLGKDLSATDVFKQGEFVDVHAVTTGKGFSGAVKRFGIRTTAAKSEKDKRTAGSLGPWKGQGHVMYRVPAPGKHGYYTRVTYNQSIVFMGDKPEDINAKGGFKHYGEVKTPYILIKGSVHGPSKRIIRLCKPRRKGPKARTHPEPTYTHTDSHQS